MSVQVTLHNIAMSATPEMQQHWKYLWRAFITSVQLNNPVILVPKDIGDQMGNTALTEVAVRYRCVKECL
jgi:hypothetical protein